MGKTDLELMVGDQEQILWRGKPQKKCFLLESIFNPMLPFALIWALFDGGVIGGFALTGGMFDTGMGLILIPFFLFHLMPV